MSEADIIKAQQRRIEFLELALRDLIYSFGEYGGEDSNAVRLATARLEASQ